MLSPRSVAVSYYNALSRNDAGAASSLVHQDAKVDVPGATLAGPDELKAWIQRFFDAFPDIVFVLLDLHEDGNLVQLNVEVSGTHTGPLATAEGAIAPTYRRFSFRSRNSMAVKAGRIDSMKISFERLDLLRQLGLAVDITGGSSLRIEGATEKDVPLLLRMIRGLADYEKLSEEVTATEDQIRECLFGDRSVAEAIIGYVDTQPVGFALFFHNYSTFLGRRGLYLEDLFVLPEWRRRGFGRELFAHLARIAVDRECGRMEWSVLNWNEPAIGFYRRLGARALDEWTVYRLTGNELRQLAAPVARA